MKALQFVGLGWLIFFLGCASSFARTETELRRIIDGALAQQHPKESGDWWRSLGPDAPKTMITMYRESDHIYERMRLLHALGWFDDPQAVDFLKSEAQGTEEDVIRNAAIRAVATSQGAKESEWVAGFLKHADADTRYATAEALQAMNDAGANEKVQAHLSREKVGWIGQKLKQEQVASRSNGSAVVQAPQKPAPVKLDVLSPELAGVWEGFRISESKSGELQSEKVTVELLAPAQASAGGWAGTIRSGAGGAQLYTFSSVVGKANRFRALLIPSDKLQGKQKAVGVSVDAQAFQSETGRALELRAPEKGLFFVVRQRAKR